MKNKIIIIVVLVFLFQIGLVTPTIDKVIKVNFIIDNKDNINLEKFEVIKDKFVNFTSSPSLYSIQIKNKKDEIIEKSNFAPAFFVLSQGKIIKFNQATISKEFLYRGDKWKTLEIYKEDNLIFKEDIEKKFCKETKLCNQLLKTLLYVVPIIIIILILLILFIKKRRENVF